MRFFATLLLLLATGMSAMAVEEPRYEVVRRFPSFELRRYPDLVVAETEVSGDRDAASSEGFRRLARYIFGQNRDRRRMTADEPATEVSRKVAMTAPVLQEASAAGWTVRFTMPSSWSIGTLPEPLDGRVRIRELPGRTVAALRWRGGWSEESRQEHERLLLEAMAREGLVAAGPVEWARYDPPWMPWFLKRNELWVAIL